MFGINGSLQVTLKLIDTRKKSKPGCEVVWMLNAGSTSRELPVLFEIAGNNVLGACLNNSYISAYQPFSTRNLTARGCENISRAADRFKK
jgi:hypothetical protein